MQLEDINQIAVVGAGNMGHQISLHCAINGYQTVCTDISEDMLKKADMFVDAYLSSRVDKGKLSSDEAGAARDRIRFTPQLKAAVKDADYIIEAVLEVLDLKRKLFADIDKVAAGHAILATNSSTIVSSKIAEATKRPEKVLNVHFFNPALVMKLVEVVQGSHVSDETAQVSMALCQRLDKMPVLLKKEVDGFLLNRILLKTYEEAEWLVEMGVATPEDIDNACIHGAGHPMGPFRLMDLTGIDLAYTMFVENFKKSGDPNDLPKPSLVEHYVKGEFGRKTGKGWYDYSDK